MKILGLIPARGGSKGVPRKNIKSLGGKPLLQYTYEAAAASKVLDKVILSSEDGEIIEVAQTLGLEVPFIRPRDFSQDTSGSLDVIKHALQFYVDKGEPFDAVCLLQTTTPFRSKTLIDQAVSKFVEERTDSLVSVREVPHEYNPHWVFEEDENSHLRIATGENEIIKRRQDLPKAYFRDGAIYITKSEVILKSNSIYGSSISYILNESEQYVNIDTMEDWASAESLIKQLNSLS
ncbi:MAG: acylneuraminate cytidylyltransferase family protein [Flavobacteriales bacterium]|nr:acylneuraminate cytidylyltransferase family protein [Flavobacteriales bacterium]